MRKRKEGKNVKYSKELYDIANLSKNEQEQSNICKIEYYKIKEEKYGIEIIKKLNNNETEVKQARKIEISEEKINELLEILKRNRVTPMELEYVLEDLNYINQNMV